MSLYRRHDLFDPYTCSPLVVRKSSVIKPSSLFSSFPSFFNDDLEEDLCFPFGFSSPYPFHLFENSPLYRRRWDPDNPVRYLYEYDKVSDFDRFVSLKGDRKYTLTKEIKGCGERKYKWEAEIEGFGERKYKWTAEINGGKSQLVCLKKADKGKKKRYNWTTEVKSEREKGEVSHTYIIKASSGSEKEKQSKKKKEKRRVVFIEEEDEREKHGAIVLRKAFSRRNGAVRIKKGKNTEMPPEYAAVIIQRSFRVYLIRRSKVLRALRDLATAKTKLKELRTSYQNFSYRRLIGRDAEETQRFSEKLTVLFLTVDNIEGFDVMVRRSKRSMKEELEVMLDDVDPQSKGRPLSMRRRRFDMPDGFIRKEIAHGVGQIVEMLETEE